VPGSLVGKKIYSVMKEKVKKVIHHLHPKRIPTLLNTFLQDESISGKLILAATVLALVVVNSPLHDAYENFWHLNFSIGLGSWSLSQDLRHWASEGLMTFFFLVVGLELKREFIRGELRDLKMASLPIAAALGGMVVPALIYASLNTGEIVERGWGIPIATDIAFAVGILVLLGRRVPLSLKIFLLTLAIADDLGAIVVIGLFYAEIIHYGYLFFSVALLLTLWLFRKQLIGRSWLLLTLGTVLWTTTHLSGIHASIIGVALGLLAPMSGPIQKASVAEKFERAFLPVSTFVALPVFAFANAGIVLTTGTLANPGAPSVMWGIILGLTLGKMLGITAATWLMIRFGKAHLPEGTRWPHIIGIGFIAGIGFTVSLFITDLAFGRNLPLLETAKISIFIASALSALLGFVILSRAKSKHTQTT
jgi:Na+:H+ antiporter, NhaA family